MAAKTTAAPRARVLTKTSHRVDRFTANDPEDEQVLAREIEEAMERSGWSFDLPQFTIDYTPYLVEKRWEGGDFDSPRVDPRWIAWIAEALIELAFERHIEVHEIDVAAADWSVIELDGDPADLAIAMADRVLGGA